MKSSYVHARYVVTVVTVVTPKEITHRVTTVTAFMPEIRPILVQTTP